MGDFTLVVLQHRVVPVERRPAAIAIEPVVLVTAGDFGLPLPESFKDLSDARFLFFGDHVIPYRLVEHLIPFEAGQSLCGLVESNDQAIAVQNHDNIAGCLDDGIGKIPLGACFIFIAFPLGYIGMYADHAQWCTIHGPGNHQAPVEHPSPATVLVQDAMFIGVCRRRASEMCLYVCKYHLDIVRMDTTFAFREVVFYLVLTIAEHFLPASREFHFVGLNIPVPDAVTCAFQCETPSFFAFSKFQSNRVRASQRLHKHRQQQTEGNTRNSNDGRCVIRKPGLESRRRLNDQGPLVIGKLYFLYRLEHRIVSLLSRRFDVRCEHFR